MTWHVVTGDAPPGFTGGVASWTERVCTGLHQAGLPVVLHARGARLAGRLAEARHDVDQVFPVRRIRTHRWNRQQARAVATAVGPQLRAGDRVLATTWPTAPGLVEPCRALGLPLVVVVHGSEITRLDRAPPGLLSLASYARFVSVSQFLAQRLAELGVQAAVLPAPVDPVVDPPGPELRQGLLVVARCTALKGIERAMDLGQALGWPVTVVGEGPALPALRQHAAGLGVPVLFEGRASWERTAQRYRGARLVAQLSRQDLDGSGAEGLGLVVLEAIAHGAPAVVSGVGGLPEAVGPGLVLEAPDDPVASASAVRGWLAAGDPIAAQRAWLGAHHGVRRTVDALRAAVQDVSP